MRHMLIALLALLILAPVQAQSDPCGFTRARTVHIFDYDSMTLLDDRAATDDDRAALARLDGIYDWVGYARGGFDRPVLEWWPVKVEVTLDDGEARYVYLYDERDDPRSDTLWVWAFIDLEVSTDANGEHLGAHHICASGGWPEADLAALTE